MNIHVAAFRRESQGLSHSLCLFHPFPLRLLSMEISLHSDDTQMPSLTSSGGDKPIFSGPVALGLNNLTHSWAS